jgi:hypothetical protein
METDPVYKTCFSEQKRTDKVLLIHLNCYTSSSEILKHNLFSTKLNAAYNQ